MWHIIPKDCIKFGFRNVFKIAILDSNNIERNYYFNRNIFLIGNIELRLIVYYLAISVLLNSEHPM